MTTQKDIKRKSSDAKALKDKEEKLDQELKKTIRLQQKLREDAKEFRGQFSERLLKLVTSGFGLVSALAWNELIKEFVKEYIKPLFGESSGLISLLIYAIIVTLLAVTITYQLSKLTERKK